MRHGGTVHVVEGGDSYLALEVEAGDRVLVMPLRGQALPLEPGLSAALLPADLLLFELLVVLPHVLLQLVDGCLQRARVQVVPRGGGRRGRVRCERR